LQEQGRPSKSFKAGYFANYGHPIRYIESGSLQGQQERGAQKAGKDNEPFNAEKCPRHSGFTGVIKGPTSPLGPGM
jgi:hypothetical protein